ncbi:MAG: type I methionyl aminopeptidase [Armatimonadota bacterium]
MRDEIVIKSPAEIQMMRRAGEVVAFVLQRVAEACQPGVTTRELDAIAEAYVRKCGAIASFKGYKGYPASLCVAVNDEVVHSIPGRRVLREGDIVGLDFGAYLNGYHADAAITVPVGRISEEAQSLLRVTEEALQRAVSQAKIGNRVGDIGFAVQSYVEAHGYSVVRELVGHGIGRSLHEKPEVPNYGIPGRGPRLREGMTLAIEPMVNQGAAAVEFAADTWTVVTADGKLSAHFEHTVAITRNGPLILTLPADAGPVRGEGEVTLWRQRLEA